MIVDDPTVMAAPRLVQQVRRPGPPTHQVAGEMPRKRRLPQTSNSRRLQVPSPHGPRPPYAVGAIRPSTAWGRHMQASPETLSEA